MTNNLLLGILFAAVAGFLLGYYVLAPLLEIAFPH